LDEALRLAIDATGARQGYIEIYSEADQNLSAAEWAIARGCSEMEVAQIREVTSRGIVAEAIATGATVHTPSALLDARFSDSSSVRRHGIEAVLCAPLGGEDTIGVLYLQGHQGGGPFSAEDVALIELFARHAGPQMKRMRTEERARREGDPTKPYRERMKLDGMVGRSHALAEVLRHVALVAPLDVTVLLTGPSGSGKTFVARTIHENSGRRGRPVVELNCAALPETLLESELFGALPGSHSTAHQAADGKVAAAEGGTLFLDEISELSAGAQAKLLQLLQSKAYYPLGATRPVSADIRVIASTNVKLEELLEQKRLREDLYYRLNLLPIRMPSLAERGEDVVPLAEHFITEASRRHGLPRLQLSPGAKMSINASEWPGNVRQLAHSVEAGLIRAAGTGAATVERRHVFPDRAREGADNLDYATFQEATREFQRGMLERVLGETGWNIVEAARRLDLTRSHTYNLIRLHGLVRGRSS
jgi:Nif-specific regulatory protein